MARSEAGKGDFSSDEEMWPVRYLFCSVKDWRDTKFGSREHDDIVGQASSVTPDPVSCRKKVTGDTMKVAV